MVLVQLQIRLFFQFTYYNKLSIVYILYLFSIVHTSSLIRSFMCFTKAQIVILVNGSITKNIKHVIRNRNSKLSNKSEVVQMCASNHHRTSESSFLTQSIIILSQSRFKTLSNLSLLCTSL